MFRQPPRMVNKRGRSLPGTLLPRPTVRIRSDRSLYFIPLQATIKKAANLLRRTFISRHALVCIPCYQANTTAAFFCRLLSSMRPRSPAICQDSSSEKKLREKTIERGEFKPCIAFPGRPLPRYVVCNSSPRAPVRRAADRVPPHSPDARAHATPLFP